MGHGGELSLHSSDRSVLRFFRYGTRACICYRRYNHLAWDHLLLVADWFNKERQHNSLDVIKCMLIHCFHIIKDKMLREIPEE